MSACTVVSDHGVMSNNSQWIRSGLIGVLMGTALTAVESVPAAGADQLNSAEFLRQMEDGFNNLNPNQLILFYSQNASIIRINDGRLFIGAENILEQFNRDFRAFQELTMQYGAPQTIPLGASQTLIYAPFSVTGISTSGSTIQFNGASTFVLESVNNRWQIVREHSSVPFLL